LAIQRLNEREAQREISPQEVGQEGEGADVREEDVGMNLGEEREVSTMITREIRNLIEEIVLVEANETPQIKENHPEASGTCYRSVCRKGLGNLKSRLKLA
jgi:hypothetical protein